jgi:predicted transcriptional regulator
MKRFTIDVSAELHRRIKTACAARGTIMADEIRAMLETTIAAPTARPRGGVVATSFKTMTLYLPPKVKRKIKEISFHEERKEHDVVVQAVREYLDRQGYPADLWEV